METELLNSIYSNSSWKKEPDFIEEYQLGREEYVVCYNIYEEATDDTYDTPGTAMELSIERLFIKGHDANDNEVVFDLTDYFHEFDNEELCDFLYEAHMEKYGE